MTPDEAALLVAAATVVAGALPVFAYYAGHARGRLAEQENLSWKLKRLERELGEARDLTDKLEAQVNALAGTLMDEEADDA